MSTARRDRACVIADGQVWCWGATGCDATSGGIEAASAPPDYEPRLMSLPRPATSVVVSYSHACALLDDATVWCWGCNASGQLGVGAFGDSERPVQIQRGPRLPGALHRRLGNHGTAPIHSFDYLP
ncbi:MAG: hypothetical protein J0L92_24880 [Deltaproteobacteria bacterium]|nr:hypothetical protein [Deltaproteobacteria bacterium]